MKTRLRILYLASEVAPFVKNGRIAEIANALPKTLFEMGHDIRIMMPKYGAISERKYTLREVIRLKEIPIRLGEESFVVSAKSAFLPETKVQVYFLDYKPYFEKSEITTDPKTGQENSDNAMRYILFSRAVMETIKLLHWEPQLIFCNDWPTALIPWLLNNEYRQDPFFAKCISLLSVHDFSRQGVFPETLLKHAGLQGDASAYEQLVMGGRANLLRSGLINADIISASAATHLTHMWKNPELGYGLSDVLKKRKEDIHEVMDGIEYAVWTPDNDTHLVETFNANQLAGKMVNKLAVLHDQGLTAEENIPLLGLFFDGSEGKNGDVAFELLDRILHMDVQVILVFADEAAKRRGLEKLRKAFAKKLAVVVAPDMTLQHRIIAGCDFTLQVACSEHLISQQMIHLRYGTLPLVNKVGCVMDALGESGDGKCKSFYFDSCDKKSILDAIKNALACYQDNKNWPKMVKKAMKLDFCWKSAAERYVKLLQRFETSKKRK
jgi:starch synthase